METSSTAPTQSSAFAPFTPPLAQQSPAEQTPAVTWPHWQRVLFRFFFSYFILQVEPWDWFVSLPGMSFVSDSVDKVVLPSVTAANAHFFHVRETLILPNGSGDTSYAWAQLWFFLSISAIACVVWTIADRKRPNYTRLAFWLRMIVRYYVASAALSYGIIKLFLLQMPFPAISQLATPLGDLLPMRLSWMFIGYSATYQFFSGAMETVAGLLLLYRRTVTAGLFAATGAFLNVFMINIAYDVPVKMYAMHLLFSCLFLLALDCERLLRFLVLNQPTPATAAYEPNFSRGWQQWGSRGVKLFLVFQFLIFPVKNGWTRYKTVNAPAVAGPFKPGVYDVRSYVVNRDTVAAGADSLRWRDVIFDNAGAGSVNTTDQVFWQRYRRGYFRYKPNVAAHTAAVWKVSAIPRDSTFLFTMRYDVPDSNTVRLHAVIRGDSIHVELVRTARHFQLAERQFHWLSEYNR